MLLHASSWLLAPQDHGKQPGAQQQLSQPELHTVLTITSATNPKPKSLNSDLRPPTSSEWLARKHPSLNLGSFNPKPLNPETLNP